MDVKDFTLHVYAAERVTITDSNGATSDPTNGGQLVNPKITDTNTTVVVDNTKTTTNTTTNNTNVVNTNTTVVTPVVPVVPVVVDTVTPGLLKTALTAAIADAAASTTVYPVLTGSYWAIKKGFTPSNSTYYFW